MSGEISRTHDERMTRRGLVASATLGVGAALIGTVPANAIAAGPSAAGDRSIYRFALRLEALQARFYAEALSTGSLQGELREFAEVVSDHESRHLAAVEKAAAEPGAMRFDFRGATRKPATFAHAARVLEDLGVSAYNGQLANLTASGMTLAARIVSVEGRHAAWIRDLVGIAPAPRPVDPGQAAKQIAAELAALGFRRTR
jgi:hypothetical protein